MTHVPLDQAWPLVNFIVTKGQFVAQPAGAKKNDKQHTEDKTHGSHVGVKTRELLNVFALHLWRMSLQAEECKLEVTLRGG